MKLQFDANQEYQLDAIKATVDLFAGQPAGVSNFAFEKAAKKISDITISKPKLIRSKGVVDIKKDAVKAELKSEAIREVFNNFKGKSLQLPPMVSAKRIAGKRLYELSRQGKVIEREPVEIEIYDIKTNDIRLPEIDFFVSCSNFFGVMVSI